MKIQRSVIIGIIAGIIIVGASSLFVLVDSLKNMNIFYFLFGAGILIMLFPFMIISVIENKTQREKDEMFLEFSRSLVESVESGIPISKAIIGMKAKNFGKLGGHLEKLSNQIQLGIPLQKALETFAYDTKSSTIIRAITLIREADKTGGNISTILESVAKSVLETEKLKAERRAAISSMVMEGYIIFLIFIIIMIVVEVQIIPITSGIVGTQLGTDTSFTENTGDTLTSETGSQTTGSGTSNTTSNEFGQAFLALLITQGLFAGLIIGKISEGDIKAGIKHSFIMVAMAVLISTGSKLIL